jgi:transposase-like protein
MGQRISPQRREVAAQRLGLGRPVDEVALTIGVSPSTIRQWRRNDPEFRKLIGQYSGAPMLRGIEVALERGVLPRVRGRRGASPTESTVAALVELGRRRGGAPRGPLFGGADVEDDPPPAA